jgi:hypothetical protein
MKTLDRRLRHADIPEAESPNCNVLRRNNSQIPTRRKSCSGEIPAVKKNDENAEKMHEHTGESPAGIVDAELTSGIFDDFFDGCDGIVD